MGIAQSKGFAVPELTAEVSLNRIREALQFQSDLPIEIRKFKIETLANDMNKLGFNITIQGKSTSDIARQIREITMPDVIGTCMIDDRVTPAQAKKRVEQLVKTINRNFGSNIQLYRNPLDPNSELRKPEDLCDDMYLVMDTVNRALDENTTAVKTKLNNTITALNLQAQRIKDLRIGALNEIASAAQGDSSRDMLKQVSTLYNITDKVIGEQRKQAETTLYKLGTALGDKGASGELAQMLEQLKESLKAKAQAGLTPLDEMELLSRIAGTSAMVQLSGMRVQTCQECLTKLGVSLAEFQAMKAHEGNYAEVVAKMVDKLQSSGHNPTKLKELLDCYRMLTSEMSVCQNDLLVGGKRRRRSPKKKAAAPKAPKTAHKKKVHRGGGPLVNDGSALSRGADSLDVKNVAAMLMGLPASFNFGPNVASLDLTDRVTLQKADIPLSRQIMKEMKEDTLFLLGQDMVAGNAAAVALISSALNLLTRYATNKKAFISEMKRLHPDTGANIIDDIANWLEGKRYLFD